MHISTVIIFSKARKYSHLLLRIGMQQNTNTFLEKLKRFNWFQLQNNLYVRVMICVTQNLLPSNITMQRGVLYPNLVLKKNNCTKKLVICIRETKTLCRPIYGSYSLVYTVGLVHPHCRQATASTLPDLGLRATQNLSPPSRFKLEAM